MSAVEKPLKINLGFTGGQVLSVRVAAPELVRLRGALGSEGWYELKAEDGTVVLDLTRVLYVLVDDEGHRVGFGS